jgi:hypothetical protein
MFRGERLRLLDTEACFIYKSPFTMASLGAGDFVGLGDAGLGDDICWSNFLISY